MMKTLATKTKTTSQENSLTLNKNEFSVKIICYGKAYFFNYLLNKDHFLSSKDQAKYLDFSECIWFHGCFYQRYFLMPLELKSALKSQHYLCIDRI